MSKSPYEILGVAETATKDEIKNAYRTLAKTHHPDKGGTVSGFTKIQKAYELLSDQKRRNAYDVLHGVVKASSQQQTQTPKYASAFTSGSYMRQQQYSSFVNQIFQSAMAQQAQASSTGMMGNSAPSSQPRQKKAFHIPRQAILQARVTTQAQTPNYLGASTYGYPYIDEAEVVVDFSQFSEYPMPGDTARLEFNNYGGSGISTLDTIVVEARYSSQHQYNGNGLVQGELRVRRLGTWQTQP